MNEIIRTFIQNKEENREQVIKVTGVKGVGKTGFVLRVAKRIHNRSFIKDGIFFLDFRDIDNVDQVSTIFDR